MNHPSLLCPTLALLSALTPCHAAAQHEDSAPAVTASATSQSLSAQAEDVLSAFSLFPSSDLLRELVRSGDEELLNMVKKKIEELRPLCDMLRTLPPERVKELMLLADAVLWQSQWLSNVYLGEFGIECEAPFDVGLLELSHSAEILKEIADGDLSAPPEAEIVLRELIELVGGEQVLDYPAAWYDEQLGEDYKTALQFYKDFCAAASEKDEQQSLALLKEQEEVLAYFAAKGEAEIWRVNKLAGFFHAALIDLVKFNMSPYPDPVLPRELRTPARLKALQSFWSTLPALKDILYR